MAVREIQEKAFNNIQEYMNWYSIQYQNQTGIKVCGLKENGENGMIAEYIQLF